MYLHQHLPTPAINQNKNEIRPSRCFIEYKRIKYNIFLSRMKSGIIRNYT
jgi:hypothetical protein